MNAKSFDDLGIPFPLFKGKVDDAYEYIGESTCSVCNNEKSHCFVLGIGCALMIKCGECGMENGLDAHDRKDINCYSCNSKVSFPIFNCENISICYECLREGKGAITKGSELGMISWEQSYNGITHGIRGMNRSDFEMIPLDDGWFGAKLDKSVIFELLRTPTFLTIQGEDWQFCCKDPMYYIGTWSRNDFCKNASDGNGKKYFERIIQKNVNGLWEDTLHDRTGIYIFECQHCKSQRAVWDLQ